MDRNFKSGIVIIDKIKYKTTSSTTCEVIGYEGDKNVVRKITIPNDIIINDRIYSVTSIGNEAFRGYEFLIDILLPTGLTSLGDYAFCGCRSLQKVICPSNMQSFGDCVFSHCFALTSISLPMKLSFMGSSVFYGCISLKSIIFPKGIASIREKMFKDCYSLTSVVLPEGLSSIENDVFENCRSLENILLPQSLVSIGGGVFRNCVSMKSVILPKDVSTMGKEVFWGCKSLASISLPDRITSIEDGMFCDCESLEDLYLPNTIEKIGDNCLSYESGEPLLLPKIGLLLYNKGRDCYGWFGDRNIKSITIPEGVKFINYKEFNKLKRLNTLCLPNSLDFVISKAKTACKNIKSGLLLSMNGTKCFGYIGNHKEITEVIIPEGVTHIQNGAFMNCIKLKHITIPSSIIDLGDNVLNGCTSLTKVIIPEGITQIRDGAFKNCSKLKDIYIPSTIIHLGKNIFDGCRSLTKVIIPEGVTNIQDEAFRNCTKLKHIAIPSSVTYLGNNVFAGCQNITNIALPVNFVLNLNLDECPFMVKYKRILELNKLAVNSFFEDFKQVPGGNKLRITGLGIDCFEISLIYKRETLWKEIYKTIDFPDVFEFIKGKARNAKALYTEEIMSNSNKFKIKN